MADFQHVLRRIEWVIYSEEVDQYGRRLNEGEEIIHAFYASHEEAMEHKDEFLFREGPLYLPKERTHNFWSSGIRCREVAIITGKLGDIEAFLKTDK